MAARSSSADAVQGLEQRPHPVVGMDVGGGQGVAVLAEHAGEVGAHRVAEDDRVGHLHHRRLEMHGEQDALLLGLGHLLGQERVERRAAHDGGIEDLAGEHREVRLEHGDVAVGGDVLDADRPVSGDGDRLLGGAEVPVAHRRDVRLRVRRPRAHRVRVVAGVGLDRVRRAAVRVALAQHRVDGAALDAVIALADVALLIVGGVARVVGDLVSLALELGDRGAQLGHRRADVGELDDVGLGRLGQLAELGEVVGDPVVTVEAIGELGQDPPGERDVAQLHLHPGDAGEGLA